MVPLFDAHLHPASLSDQDLESMRFFGVVRALAVAHHTPATPKGLFAHFDRLLETDVPRLKKAGIESYAAVGVHPRSVPRRGLTEVLARLPDYLSARPVVALGEIGLQDGTEEEEEALLLQLGLAKRLKLPVVLHAPTHEKEKRTRRMLTLVRSSGIAPHKVLVDHANGRTVRLILACGHYAGLTLHPDELTGERAVAIIRKLGPERLVLNTDAGDRASDILSLPRTLRLLERAQLSEPVVARVAHENADELFRLRAL